MRSDYSPIKDTTCDRRKIIPQAQKEVSHQTQLIDGKRSFLVFEKAIEFCFSLVKKALHHTRKRTYTTYMTVLFSQGRKTYSTVTETGKLSISWRDNSVLGTLPSSLRSCCLKWNSLIPLQYIQQKNNLMFFPIGRQGTPIKFSTRL